MLYRKIYCHNLKKKILKYLNSKFNAYHQHRSKKRNGIDKVEEIVGKNLYIFQYLFHFVEASEGHNWDAAHLFLPTSFTLFKFDSASPPTEQYRSSSS